MTYQTLKQSLSVFQARWLSDKAPSIPRKRDFIISRARYDWHYHRIVWKRAFDVTFSLAALIFLSPLIAVVAILVKLTSRGPIFFRQERIGVNRRDCERRRIERGDNPAESESESRLRERRVLVNYGKPFAIYKFRTMEDYAEKNGKPQWAIKDDPRVTAFGMILRKSRIDEIPQFMNVIKGDMSIVGPRPERSFFIGKVEKDIPEFQLRLRAKPGITGLAQVKLGYTNNTDGLRKKLSFDLEYIRSLSIWADFKIVLKTFGVVVTGKGAF